MWHAHKTISKISPKKQFFILTSLVSICFILGALYVFFLKKNVKETFILDASDRDNHNCMSILSSWSKLNNFQFSKEAQNIIGSLKPGLTRQPGAIGYDNKIHMKCIITDTDDKNLPRGLDREIKDKYKMNVIYDDAKKQYMCVGGNKSQNTYIELPYNSLDIRGCEIILDRYDDPKALETDLTKLYRLSKQEIFEEINNNQLKLTNAKEQYNLAQKKQDNMNKSIKSKNIELQNLNNDLQKKSTTSNKLQENINKLQNDITLLNNGIIVP